MEKKRRNRVDEEDLSIIVCIEKMGGCVAVVLLLYNSYLVRYPRMLILLMNRQFLQNHHHIPHDYLHETREWVMMGESNANEYIM